MASLTLAQTLNPDHNLLRKLILVAGGTGLTILCAQISIPFVPVPFTMQTFAVLACGLALGPRLGLLSQALYVLLGALGLSVFAEGKSGMATLMGPTGGYLIGFAIAGFVLGMLAEKGWDRSLLKTFLAMQIGHMIILTLGTAWLSVSLGMSKAIQLGFAPFLVGEVAKSLLACLVFPTLRRYV